MTKKSRDIEFIYEMGTIRLIERMWRRFSRYDFANLAEHHFRMFWIAMIIAAKEGGVDTGKIAKMVLIHDIAESRTGDVDYLARQYVIRNEELGIKDMLAETSIEKEFLELWQEYEDKQTLEAQIVKDADNLDVDFELAEQAMHGSTLNQDWKDNRTFVSENKLYTKTAKELFQQIGAENPHNWHINGRTRRNAGDWQK